MASPGVRRAVGREDPSCGNSASLSVALGKAPQQGVGEPLRRWRVEAEEQLGFDQFEFHESQAAFAIAYEIDPRIEWQVRNGGNGGFGKRGLLTGRAMRMDLAAVIVLDPEVAACGGLAYGVGGAALDDDQRQLALGRIAGWKACTIIASAARQRAKMASCTARWRGSPGR